MTDFFGLLSYILIVVSMYQTDLVKLRLWAAVASISFIIQFILLDSWINVLGQLGLMIYGIYKANKESKA